MHIHIYHHNRNEAFETLIYILKRGEKVEKKKNRTHVEKNHEKDRKKLNICGRLSVSEMVDIIQYIYVHSETYTYKDCV